MSGITEGQGQSGPRRFFCFSPRGLCSSQARLLGLLGSHSLDSPLLASFCLRQISVASESSRQEPNQHVLPAGLPGAHLLQTLQAPQALFPASWWHSCGKLLRILWPSLYVCFPFSSHAEVSRECTLFFQVSRATGKVMPNTAQG